MKKLFILLVPFIITSCISLRKAPSNFTYRIEVAKKFKRQFPKELAYIFEDPKDANQFYKYINTKFQLNDTDVGYNVPITIDNKSYFITYHEAEIADKKLNLLGIAVDATLAVNDLDPVFDQGYVKRNGHWFLALTVYDENNNNCLKSKYPERKNVLDFLNLLQNEYLNSHSL